MNASSTAQHIKGRAMDSKQQVFQLIDALLKWEGQYSATDVKSLSGIGRTTVQKHITAYKALYPANCTYSASLKSNQVLNTFKGEHWSGNFRDYQQLIKDDGYANLTQLETICHLSQPENDQTLRILNYACRKNQILEVDYGSLSDPTHQEGRHIAPHSIVMDGLRAHVRAYCYKNKAFRDFIIGRFRTTPEIDGVAKANVAVECDHKWNTHITLTLCADSALSQAQQKNIEREYCMQQGVRTLSTPIALLPYVMKRLRLDIRHHNPEAQQLMIEPACLKQIKQYLPSY